MISNGGIKFGKLEELGRSLFGHKLQHHPKGGSSNNNSLGGAG